MRAVLVELDPQAGRAGPADADGRDGVRVRIGDAGDVASFDDVVPVDPPLLCGIFGNLDDDDIRRTIAAVPAMLAPGGTVIWTRGRFSAERDLRPLVRSGSSRPVSTRSPSTANPSRSASASPAGRST